MGYRKKEESLFELLIHALVKAPWWVSAAFGGIIWCLGYLAKMLWPKHFLVQAFTPLWPVLLLLLGVASVSAWESAQSRAALRKIESLRDLQEVPWQEFEQLTATYYREIGYTVDHTGRAGPDGGIDLKIRKDGKRILVQCKRYTARNIGVQAVREFFGVVVAAGADKGIFITTTEFTPEAMSFGLSQAGLELIPGTRFAQMVHHVRTPATGPRVFAVSVPSLTPGSLRMPVPDNGSVTPEPPDCPRCHSPMIQRRAKRGLNAGNLFWGCPQYPKCAATRRLDAEGN